MKQKRGKPYDVERNLLKEMKGECHDLIDEIYNTGMPLWVIYSDLRKRLKCEYGKEHFSAMKTYEEVERAMIVLDQMKKQRLISMQPRKKKKKAVTLSERLQVEKNRLENSRKRALKLQKQEDSIALKKISRTALHAQIAKTARINQLVLRTPKPLQRIVRAVAIRVL
jgi:predicted GTPase